MTWTKLTAALIEERGHGCEYCGNAHIDPPHHAVIFRIRKKRDIVDVPKNVLLLCPSCHRESHAQVRLYKRRAWSRLCERYGRNMMIFWLDNLPLKVKPLLSELEHE